MGKVNTTKDLANGISQKQIDDISEFTGKYLSDEEKVLIRIPSVPGAQDDMYVECCINGYNYIIKRGESVSVPNSIAQLLHNAGVI